MAQAFVISLDEDMFYCGNCKNVFNTLQLFLSHKNSDCKTETGTNEINSESTHEITMSASNQYAHPNDTKKCDTEVKCSLCKKKFKKPKSLKAHLKIHDEKPQQCLVCGRCFLYNSHLQRHVITHKVWPDGISETTAKSVEMDLLSYTCLYCDLVLSNYNQFRLHMKNHSALKKYKCVQGQCNSFYETVESLIHHVISAHKSPTYTCHNCFEAFYCLEDIAAHFQAYNNTCIPQDPPSQQFKCLQCDAVFKKADKLSLHLLTENHKKACIHCDKVFASDKRLRLHLQIHRKCKPFQCDVCKQSFHLKKYLATHLARHGDRKFTCSICKSTFKRQDLLHRHMKSHQIRKLYKCPFNDTLNCKKEFSRSDKLKMHLKYHTNKMTLNKRNTKEQHIAGTKNIYYVNARQFRVTDQVYFDIHNEDKPLGRIVIGLFGDLAPKAVKNFKVLATKGIQGKSYKGTSFNRIIKRFMVQGGDVLSDDGLGSISIYGETFPDENLDTEHSVAGFVSMANKGKNTNGCQFLITTTGTPWLDSLHTVVGKVVEGQNVVHLVEHTPTDAEDRPTKRVFIADCGIVPTPQPFYVSDDPYDLWSWIKASAVPLTMSFSILGFFHWMIRKMEI